MEQMTYFLFWAGFLSVIGAALAYAFLETTAAGRRRKRPAERDKGVSA